MATDMQHTLSREALLARQLPIDYSSQRKMSDAILGESFDDAPREDVDDDKPATGTVASSTMMVANCAIGAGVLSFPFAMRCCGVALGTTCILICACMLLGSLHIIATASRLSGGKTYQDSVKLVLGPRLGRVSAEVLSLTVYVYILGVGTAFLNVICDQLLPMLFASGSSLTQGCSATSFESFACRWPLVCLYACPLFLLCLAPNIGKFKFLSTFAVCSICYMVLVVVKYGLTMPHAEWVWVNTEQPELVFKAIPLIFYAFNCHLAYIPIFQELRPSIRHVQSQDTVALGAYLICLVTYLTTGIVGYLAFGPLTPGDVLRALPNTAFGSVSVAGFKCEGGQASLGSNQCCGAKAWFCPYDVDVARIGIALTVTSSYPILQFVARMCIDDVLVDRKIVAKGHSNTRFVLEAVVFVCITATVSIMMPSLTDVLDNISSLFATLQVTLCPALLLWKIYIAHPSTCASVDTDEAPFRREDDYGSINGEHGLLDNTTNWQPTYFQTKMALLSPLQQKGMPNVSKCMASCIVGFYVFVGLGTCIMFYATLGVEPISNPDLIN